MNWCLQDDARNSFRYEPIIKLHQFENQSKLDELNDILERKLRNEKCLRIAAEESLMDLQVVIIFALNNKIHIIWTI